MKLNNKGFAITAVLYGLLILFVFLVGSYLTVLTAKKNRVDKITSEVEKVVVASEYISNLFSKTGTVTNNGITYDIDATHGLIDTSIMYKDLGDSIVVYRGDVNADGVVNTADLELIVNHTSKIKTFTNDIQILLADVNNDGIVNAIDVVYMAKGEPVSQVTISKSSSGATNYILSNKVNTEIRYYGNNPNNYVNIGDKSLWRIIGIVDGNFKLIRNESIGAYSWDTSPKTVNSGYGINEWSQADLMKLLNPGFESNTDLNDLGSSIIINNSLWFDQKNGNCYSGWENKSNTCDFTSFSISDKIKNNILNVSWNLSGNDSLDINLLDSKIIEKTPKIVANQSDGVSRKTLWQGKVGLPYPSDYGYATDLAKCSKTLSNFDNSDNSYACRGNNWMYFLTTKASSSSVSGSRTAWLLFTKISSSSRACNIDQSGKLSDSNCFYPNNVYPVMYLDSKLLLRGGNGSSSDPYVIG